ncbi:MAG TPA: methyltransferase domain-containing protein [Nitrosopumilaceae archaeon]|nr:methyltransferase domain-containing protein [Nitrosopumilaceae archaeon]
MQEWSLEYLSCIKCQKKLELDKLVEDKEITEGFLICNNCNISYPIICKIPILYDDFVAYLVRRTSLGGEMLLKVSPKMKRFVKNSLSKIKTRVDDRTKTESNWTRIYQNSKDSRFYSLVKKTLDSVPKSKLVLEHGCSIGLVTEHLAKNHDTVFGIDSSYYSILEAKKSKKKNLDYFVADSLENPFGNQKFGLVVALNLLEIIEPANLLELLSRQTSNAILLSSPYDYERGKDSVKKPILENELRKKLHNLGFAISPGTKKPSFIPWKLLLNSRASLNYMVDLILANRRSNNV